MRGRKDLTVPPNSVTMLRMFRPRLVAMLLLWGAVDICPAAARVRVVATIFPLTDMVREIGGEAVEVATLLPAGASPHTFEPAPSQIREIVAADVVVQVGAGLDNWAAKLLAARRDQPGVVTVSDGLSLLGGADGHGGDPHVWLDPVLVREHVVPAILGALRRAAPAESAALERRAEEFRAALTRLDGEIRATLEGRPRRSYIAFHSAWRYFGQRYGLDEVAVIEDFPGKEPSAREIAIVVRKARAAKLQSLLIEPQFSPRIAEQIAREFGGRALVVDPIGGPHLAGRDSYVELMRHNLRVFAEALQ